MQRDILLTYLAQAWIAIVGVAFVPVYIRFLGIEAYGVIGLFATLQAMLVILDLGMTPTLMREIARFSGGEHGVQGVRDLLRSVEITALAMAALIALAIWAGSGWLAHSWFHSQSIPPAELARALGIMGTVSALRFVEGIFRGAILGLQRQVLYNVIAATMATIRAVGAIGVLSGVSCSLDAFFVWQGLISIVTLASLAAATYGRLPPAERHGRFSLEALLSIWRFAAGMLGISLLSLMLTQVDKVLLSRLLSLTDYAHYMLATLVASALETLVAPLFQALTPRFSKLHAAGKEDEFVTLYHAGAQLVSVFAGSAGIVLIGFGQLLLTLWTNSPALAAQVFPLMRVLALGYMFNIMMWVPYQAQLAYRWTGLTLRINLAAVCLLVPLLWWTVPRFGAMAAAWVWVGLNAAYILVGVQLMHRRILKSEKWRWYRNDLVMPLGWAAVTAALLRFVLPLDLTGRLEQLGALAFASAATLLSAALASPMLRAHGSRLLLGWRFARR